MVQITTESPWLNAFKRTVELLPSCALSQIQGETPTLNLSDC